MIRLIDCGKASQETKGIGVVFWEHSPPPWNHWG